MPPTSHQLLPFSAMIVLCMTVCQDHSNKGIDYGSPSSPRTHSVCVMNTLVKCNMHRAVVWRPPLLMPGDKVLQSSCLREPQRLLMGKQ